MYARVLTAGLYGLSGEPSWVETDVENGLPGFFMVGLADQAIREAKERIRSAILNVGCKFPDKRITVNLTPANRRKEGSHFDLPIAVGLMLASEAVLCRGDLSSTAFLGELTLDGRVLGCDGVLPMVTGLQRSGVQRVVLPKANAAEAGLVKGMEIMPVGTLSEAAEFIEGGLSMASFIAQGYRPPEETSAALDFADIRGQQAVKRAAQVAAAGGHGLLMIGPPGTGKSMVGKRIPGILPDLTYEEQLEVTQIYSVAGQLDPQHPFLTERPFRAPHHNLSAAALAGGGTNPRPGEISLSHCGVLFLDELPEFAPAALECLRQPLEDGQITIARAGGRVTYPARFMLVAAMNPCRCGYYGDPVKTCTCNESERKKYIGKVSGPLLDRIDMHVAVERVAYREIRGDLHPVKAEKTDSPVSSAMLREGVVRAVEMQKKRYDGLKIRNNAGLTPRQTEQYCPLDAACSRLMEAAFSRYSLSARAYHRILRTARTVADLEGSEAIRKEHVLEALSYRMPERFFE
ncbi:MAG: YifB family Mg chelatase-like AAA ATPase [Firmicutes bacterium]|nr:YifB family Mg chelatase-like AAA ATPase [Bacillota bacterium]